MVFDTPPDGQKRCLPVLLARAELERRNAGTPFEGAVVLQVLVGIPERTIIRGIHTHTRVVPPPAQISCLGPRAFYNTGFNRQETRGISWGATSIANAGVEAVTGDTIAECKMADFVHGDTPHPAVGRVPRISTLLSQDWDPVRHGLASRIEEFVPSRADDPISCSTE
jgi:hypothetical protein